jgi:hypothetical protein
MAAPTTSKAPRTSRKPILGRDKPRISPPLPLRHGAKEMAELAEKLGQPLWPWQALVMRYLTATIGDRWLYPEVAVLVARQNGKTTVLDSLVISRLLAGHRVLHAAQNRDLPIATHMRLADILEQHYPKLIAKPRGITFGSGKEGLRLTTGGTYHIIASTRGGARGKPADTLLIDEVREFEDTVFTDASLPTVIASKSPQVVYLSNAGHSMSVVLNALKARAGTDPRLAYLEWSAAPDRAPDDVAGWLEANPSIGHNPNLMENLGGWYRSNVLGGTMQTWETEHLCRWTVAKTELLITPEEWAGQLTEPVRQAAVRPSMGVKMDPSGERVSAVIAWPGDGEKVNLDVVADVTGDPVDVERLGPDLARLAKSLRVSTIAFDPATDADLMRHMTRESASITGRDYASATERFVRLVAGRKLVVHDPGNILATDLAYTTRRVMAAGTSIAVKAGSESTNTAAEAAIRAVWAAAAARPRLMIY